MKKVFNYIIPIALLMFLATACEDVLDQDPVSTFNEQVVFKDINIVKAYVGKCYDRMGGNTNNGILGAREDLLSSGTDQTLCIHRPSNYTHLKGTLSPDQLGFFANTGYGGFMYWDNLYANIQNLNYILDNIDNVPTKTTSEDALKTRLKGEAYFIRAYMYGRLLMNYGGVVIRTTAFKLGEDFLDIKRSTLQETLDQVLADCDKAIELLPASMEQGRATRAAAAALKSRVLLFCASPLVNGGYEPTNPLVSFTSGSQAQRWEAARDAAKAIMDGTYGTFKLAGTTNDPPSPMTEADIKAYADNYFNIFNQKGKWNDETIWGIQFPLTGGNVNRANIWYGPNGYHNWGNNDPTEPAVREYEMADGTPFVWDIGLGENLRKATAAELAANPYLNPYYGREPRFYGTILYHGAPWQQRPSDATGFDPYNKVQTGHFYNLDGTVKAYGIDTRQGLIESWNGTKNGYYLKKFMDPATVGQYYYNTNTWVEFRYAEVLLNYAEACIELGGAEMANGIDALNMVRNRAGLPDRDRNTTDQALARQWVRHERYIEFFAEGHQYYDMRRWMTAPQVIKNVYPMKIKEYVNGDMEWFYDVSSTTIVDSRSWAKDAFYWLPISRTEMNKAPGLVQNPGYQ
ncbi:MAG TPA: RagB/SusD family nutrient uptake outer membrane protein [Bacteroidales bacterium]|nr:RagB/SusD family nutrient uptake outer membrane protein [Bacteroidales bacterium]HOK75854.1 RagB/SusD family nutrient uptake outer membrane protein [Bacteroidales bacterium]HOM41602.1 RagB/SusD family nutrient uptake outer membrane protein [Bacteroidales bacterium]HPP93500.1 RagB/SusD family nutrient uptake outer membrane protein [Bacteroidales bacterium]HRR17092.1 RagB/SusD family nutrient uptake outer membrane protein [Bacteroidales bacterium]